MSVATTVEPDLDNLTLDGRRRLRASVEWEPGANPEKPGRRGTAEYPTTFEPYDLSAGAEMAHVMTGPDGDKHEGVWRIEAVDPPRRSLELSDADVDEDGQPNDGLALTGMAMNLGAERRHPDDSALHILLARGWRPWQRASRKRPPVVAQPDGDAPRGVGLAAQEVPERGFQHRIPERSPCRALRRGTTRSGPEIPSVSSTHRISPKAERQS